MNHERILKKLNVLADAAKYDVSCSSSGSTRKGPADGVGDASRAGICHSYSEDGRCISLLKILLTNMCIYDCAYCVSRQSNSIKREMFTVREVVDLTMNFYRRNYIEGLFLSSGIIKNADFTMEQMVQVAKTLREEEKFGGYIHLKTIPKASPELIKQAGLYADRLSINLEIPTVSGLKHLAPEKHHDDMIIPMKTVQAEAQALADTRKHIKSTPKFAPAGQTTQVIVGATDETDQTIIKLANHCYDKLSLKRVYYSGYVPILADNRLPAQGSEVPMVRENRLYQADWLMRFYGFDAHEILDDQPFLDLDVDPKLAWAIRHRECFPVVLQVAPYEMILRVPGIGVKSAMKIVRARRRGQITLATLKQMRVAVNRAKYFAVTKDHNPDLYWLDKDALKNRLMTESMSKHRKAISGQLSLF